ncbi:hypothetical protein BRD01_02310, partial [Halobacteriales archaeon QS_8_65_32]
MTADRSAFRSARVPVRGSGTDDTERHRFDTESPSPHAATGGPRMTVGSVGDAGTDGAGRRTFDGAARLTSIRD